MVQKQLIIFTGDENNSNLWLQVLFYIIILYIKELLDKQKMQGNIINTSLLRKSYGYQGQEFPAFNTTTSRYNAPSNFQNNSPQVQYEWHNSHIKQMENKLQNIIKTKFHTQTNIPLPVYQQNLEKKNPSNRPQFIPTQLLRGSCQEVIGSFDYNNYKNKPIFNPPNKFKFVQQKDMRKFPVGQNQAKKSQITKDKYTQNQQISKEPVTQGFSKKLSPSKNMTKFFNDKQIYKKGHQQLKKSPPKSENDFQKIFKNNKEGNISTKTSLNLKSTTQIQEKQKPRNISFLQIKNIQKINPEKAKHSKMINGFQFGPILGKGKFGQVYLARHHQIGFITAIKKLQKSKIQEFKMLNQFTKQIRLHSCLDHPNIVKFYGIFQDFESIYLVMQYLNRGTLFDYLNDVNALSVKQAAQFLKDVIQALTYMHDKSIAHRDIKPENIVISSEKVAKLCDFGWSALVEKPRKTYCGTFDYAPPEILQRKDYDTSVDIWCIGVLTYELLTGKVPFEGQERNIIRDKIVNVDKIKIDYPKNFPAEAQEFIEALVQKDPKNRPKCSQLLKFNLFTMHLQKGKGKRCQ